MLTGDLARTPVADVLLRLAAGRSTGRLDVAGEGGTACVHLHDGWVYAASVPQPRPSLAARLLTHGAVSPATLSQVLASGPADQQELAAVLLAGCLVDPAVVDAFLHEQVLSAVGEMTARSAGSWSFSPHARTRDDVAPPLGVPTLLAAVEHRAALWRQIADVVDGPDVVPVLAVAGSTPDGTLLDADAWALLQRVDGARTLGELAQECGLTLFEAGRTVHDLLQAGLVDLEDGPAEPVLTAGLPPGLAARLTAALAPAGPPPLPDDDLEGPDADVVDLGQVRAQAQRAAQEARTEHEAAVAAEAAQQARDQAQEAAERVAAELAAQRAEAQQRARAEAEAEAQEHARAEAERVFEQRRLAEEQQRRAAEQARLVAERAARVAAQREAESRREEEQRVQAERARLLAVELTALDDPPPPLHVLDPASAAAAFAELRAAADSGPPTSAPPPLVEAAVEQGPAPDWQQGWAAPPAPAADTDTASLLRELSSLGLDDEGDGSQPRRTAAAGPTGPAAATAARRRKGLFGR